MYHSEGEEDNSYLPAASLKYQNNLILEGIIHFEQPDTFSYNPALSLLRRPTSPGDSLYMSALEHHCQFYDLHNHTSVRALSPCEYATKRKRVNAPWYIYRHEGSDVT